jgi:hypothetical protein
MPTDLAAWTAIVTAFRGRLADEIGGGLAALFECDFSTSTDVERVASQIVLLDAYSPFFSYWLMCICGIPSITLTGTVADWQQIRERIDVIAELDLATWCGSLAPIADQFVRAAAGDVDVGFWRRIYNPADAYGGEVINAKTRTALIKFRVGLRELALERGPVKRHGIGGLGDMFDAVICSMLAGAKLVPGPGSSYGLANGYSMLRGLEVDLEIAHGPKAVESAREMARTSALTCEAALTETRQRLNRVA